jgi:tetratricopeptide (TPR) repeat protein/ubiquitin-protein ligase
MGIATKQLEAIFKEINERFKKSPYVTIKPTDGDPPERYEITYTIKGLHQSKNKEVQEATHHTISIAIPFGFPHFPPNCKPVSPIFHPDFDQAAICIGDFWNKESSIPDLIVHIGRMIGGEIFSTDNAFNEEAVIWYRQHRDKLPFELPDFSSTSRPSPVSEPASFAALETLEIDTIEESDFDTDFDFFNLEKQDKSQTASPPAPEIDLDLFRLMVKQKRFYTLYKHLQAIPADKQFKDFDQLRNTAHRELGKAKHLFQQGLDFEHQGQPGQALEKFHHLTETVTDYPEIEESINRTQRALEVLNGFAQKTGEKLEPEGKIESEAPKTEPPEKQKLTFFNEKPDIRIAVLPIIIFCSVTVFLGIVAYFIFSINSEFKHAEKAFSNCQIHLEKNIFKAAEQSCSEALSIVNGIHLLKKKERVLLAENIQKTLNSQKMRQGLAGMVLVNGQYVPKSTEDALLAFNKLAGEGDSLMANLSWKHAEDSYEQALNIASKITMVEKTSVEKVQKNLALVQVNLASENAKKFKESGDFDKAVIVLEKAFETAKSLDDAVKTSTIKSMEPLLYTVRFLNSRKAGNTFYAEGDWQKALEQYRSAVDYMKHIQNLPASEIAAVHENKTKAELYATIKSGKDAFDNAQWDEAIHKYDTAIKMLKENSDILSKVTSEDNSQKLSRVMLQASIIRDQQEVARKLKEGKNKLAVEKLQSIIDTISKSPFGRENEYQQISKEAHLSIAEIKANQIVSESISYLTENFRDIFAKNYSAATPESLSDPKASFVKKVDERFLFKLECNEKSQGRPLRLVMNYIYDPATKQWQFYGEKN